MNLNDKLAAVSNASANIDANLESALGLNQGPDGTHAFLRSFMSPAQLMLWDVSVYFEGEAVRCQESGSHFSALLASVSMNEALLALSCLMSSEEVKSTAVFQNQVKRAKNNDFEAVLAGLSLEPLIQIAAALRWLPSEIIDTNTKDLLADVVEEMRDDPLPNEFLTRASEWKLELERDAGRAMLLMTQDLRNYIHPTRWIKYQKGFHAVSFNTWCQVAVRLSNEIRAALMYTWNSKSAAQAAQYHTEMEKILQEIDPIDRTLIEEGMKKKILEMSGVEVPSEVSILDLMKLASTNSSV